MHLLLSEGRPATTGSEGRKGGGRADVERGREGGRGGGNPEGEVGGGSIRTHNVLQL